MTLEEYTSIYTPEDAVGWHCIDAHLATLYGERKPRHYAPPLHFIAGGTDPLDGTSFYDHPGDPAHIHVVSYGLSALYYDESAVGALYSGLGFELTFRVVPEPGEEGDPTWVTGLMNNLARYLHDSGRWFEPNEFIPGNGPIRLGRDTDITGLAIAEDPELGTITTPHGEVRFLQLVGLTTAEVEQLQQDPTVGAVEDLLNAKRAVDPLLVTRL
ncbi:MAG TPA: suppressor of fused domain protein [Flavobacteriales bacterium]|nr:suppressor of fused domain protein [Flavobacteriales bacterium]HPF91340.1 suppressor of fused domain protein [Flavobacteriales bacterium]